MHNWRLLLLLLVPLACTACAPLAKEGALQAPTLWRFNSLDRVGGLPVRHEGDPELIETPLGRAIVFDGKEDALFVPRHPLAGAATFTFEAIFRPDGGPFEQRWFHLAEASPAPPPGADPPVDPSGPRFLFEIRVAHGEWYLDAFVAGRGYSQALMMPEKRHPLGRWYHVAQVYDGRMYRSYVNGVLQAEAEIAFVPQGPGHSSIGTRINRRDYFNGAVFAARFTPRALATSQFLALP